MNRILKWIMKIPTKAKERRSVRLMIREMDAANKNETSVKSKKISW